VRIFFGQEDHFFHDFVRTSIMNGPLAAKTHAKYFMLNVLVTSEE